MKDKKNTIKYFLKNYNLVEREIKRNVNEIRKIRKIIMQFEFFKVSGNLIEIKELYDISLEISLECPIAPMVGAAQKTAYKMLHTPKELSKLTAELEGNLSDIGYKIELFSNNVFNENEVKAIRNPFRYTEFVPKSPRKRNEWLICLVKEIKALTHNYAAGPIKRGIPQNKVI